MNAAQWFAMTFMVIIATGCFIEIGSKLFKERSTSLLTLLLLYIITLLSILLVVITSNENFKRQREIEAECPQYEKIDNVYILKK